MWITLENGKRANVKSKDFSELKNTMAKKKPKEVALATIKVLMGSKQLMRELAEQTFAQLEQLEADSMGLGINGKHYRYGESTN